MSRLLSMEKPTLTIVSYPRIELRPVIGPEHAILMIADDGQYQARWHMTDASARAAIEQIDAACPSDVELWFGEKTVCVVSHGVAVMIASHMRTMLGMPDANGDEA